MEVKQEEIDRFKELLEQSDDMEELNQNDVNKRIALIIKTLGSDTQQSVYEAACDLLCRCILDNNSCDSIDKVNIIERKRKLPPFCGEIQYNDGRKIKKTCNSTLNTLKEFDTEWSIATKIIFNCLIRAKNQRGQEITIILFKNNPRILTNGVQFKLSIVVQSIADAILKNQSSFESVIPILLKEISSAFLNTKLEHKTAIAKDVFNILFDLIPVPNQFSNLFDIVESLLTLIEDNDKLFKTIMNPTTEKLLSIINYERISNTLQTQSFQCIAIILEANEDYNSFELSILPKIVDAFNQLIVRKYIHHNWHTDLNKHLSSEDSFKRIINCFNKEKYIVVKSIFETLFYSQHWNDQIVSLIILQSMVKVKQNAIQSNLSLYSLRIFQLIDGCNHSVLLHSINTMTALIISYNIQFDTIFHKNIFEKICTLLNTYTNYGMMYTSCITFISLSMQNTTRDILKTCRDNLVSSLDMYFKNYSDLSQYLLSLSLMKTSLDCVMQLVLKFQDDDSYILQNMVTSLLHFGQNVVSRTYADIYIDWLDCMFNIFELEYFSDSPLKLNFLDLFITIDFRTLQVRGDYNDDLIKYLKNIQMTYTNSHFSRVFSKISIFSLFITEIILKVSKINLITLICNWKNNMSCSDVIIIDTCFDILSYILHDIEFTFEYLHEVFHVVVVIYCNSIDHQCSIAHSCLLKTIIEYFCSKNHSEAIGKFRFVVKSFSDTINENKSIFFSINCINMLQGFIHDTSVSILGDYILRERFKTFCQNITEIISNDSNKNENYLSMNSDFKKYDLQSGYLEILIKDLNNLHFGLYNKLGRGYELYFNEYVHSILNLYFTGPVYYDEIIMSCKCRVPFNGYSPNVSHEIFKSFTEFIEKALKDNDVNTYCIFQDFVSMVILLAPINLHGLLLFLIDYFETKIHLLVIQIIQYDYSLSIFMSDICNIMKYCPHLFSDIQSSIYKWLDFLKFCDGYYPTLNSLTLDILQNKFEVNCVLQEFQIHQALDSIFRIINIVDDQSFYDMRVGEFLRQFEV